MRVPARLAGVILVVVAPLIAGACGDDGAVQDDAAGTSTEAPSESTTPGEIQGLVRDDLLDVGAVTLPDVTNDQEPVPFVMKADPGRLRVVYFGYTYCPDVCPTSLAALRSAYRKLGDRAELIDTAMVTVDPDRDLPKTLTKYLAAFFPERYHALRTTDEDELERAEDAFLASSTVTKDKMGEVEVSHTGTTYLVDETGHVVVEWPFGAEADDMAADMSVFLDKVETS